MEIDNLDVGSIYNGGSLVNNVFLGSEVVWMRDFPNSEWTTPIGVPVGVRVNDGGVVKQRVEKPKRCDSGCILYSDLSDKPSTAKIGGNAITYGSGVSYLDASSITPYESALDDLGNRIFELDNTPKLNKTLSFNGTSNATVIIEGSENYLSKSNDWSISVWCNDISATGYLWGKAGTLESNRTGLYVYADGTYRMWAFGYASTNFSSASTSDYKRFTTKYDATAKQVKTYINGILVNTLSTPNGSENTLPIALGGRFDNNSGVRTFTYMLNGALKGLKLFNRLLTDDEIFSDYYNCNNRYIVSIIGSSTAYGTGPWPVENSWVNLSRISALQNDIEIFNYAFGGTTFYEGVRDGYSIPAYVTSARPSPNLNRNIDRAINRCSDSVISSYASNFSVSTNMFIQGPEVWSEYKAVMEDMNNFSSQNDVSFYLTTPQPLNVAEPRPNLGYEVANELNNLSYSVDFFTDHADSETKLLLATFDNGDGVHQNNAGHALMKIEAESAVLSGPYFKVLNQLERREVLPYPLAGVWETPSEVPVGVRILAENGGIYLKTADGFEPLDAYLSFNGEFVLDEFGNRIQVDFGYNLLSFLDEPFGSYSSTLIKEGL